MGLAFDLLAHCCGLARGIPPKSSMAAQSACAVLDEERFIALAKQHKVAGTAYAGLAKAGISLSQDGMRRLSREAMVGHATRSLLLRDWREIVAAFKAGGIRALTIKGPASSIQLYGDALTREYYDLDILADIEDIGPVLPVMTRLGYALTDTLPLSSTMQTSSFVQKKSHHVNFRKAGRPFHIEIHGKTWQDDKAFSPGFMEKLLDRAIPLDASEEWGDTLALADHVLFMIAHGTQHAWCLLHWLLDLAVVLERNDEVMLQVLSAQIRSLGMERQLKLACAVAQSVYPVKIPEPLQNIIAKEKAHLALPMRFALARLKTGGRDHATVMNVLLHSAVFMPSLTKGLIRKTRLIIRPFLTPRTDAEALPLPKPLQFLYLPLRPFFVLTRRLKRRFGYRDVHAA